jgi:hypothetical protein
MSKAPTLTRYAGSSSAANFFLSTVRPTAEEFLSEPRNVRRGRLAAITLYHMADHAALDEYSGNNRKVMVQRLENLRNDLVSTCPDFALIRDIADASKHAILSAAKKAPRQISTAKQITRPQGIFGAPFGEAVFGEASIVMVRLDSGQRRPLSDIVNSVLTMWERRLFPTHITRSDA